ncbi:MAG: hypothetical protein MUO17_05035 [Dehalococcoidales bacterium]|nr:hypothetical protein [Dehalococcoidales bacterium]
MKLKLIVIVLLLVCLLGGGCASVPDFDDNLGAIVKPYRFSFVKWELGAFAYETRQWLGGEYIESPTETVLEYFSLVGQMQALEWQIVADETADIAAFEAELNRLEEQRAALVSSVEQIIADQIREVLHEQDIFNPWDKCIGLRITFPPVNFIMSKLPYLLVISPRDRIESLREINLCGNLTLEEIESIEAEADALGVSSLVVALGGAGALYPTLVLDDASLRFTIDVAVEEWLHQYLALKPQGFRYILDLLGISRDYEIATMNETLAGIVSAEIGALVLAKYYPDYPDYPDYADSSPPPSDDGFDFNREMREIRIAVDAYLADGEIELAEEFMEEKQQYLLSMGYYIRKLNQAYFAFHGAYADDPTSISPIGFELKKLRGQTDSLKEFLNTVADMTSRQDLQEMLDSLE